MCQMCHSGVHQSQVTVHDHLCRETLEAHVRIRSCRGESRLVGNAACYGFGFSVYSFRRHYIINLSEIGSMP